VHCAFLNICPSRYCDVIEVYFLPVGHTHGQIDQMFSCLAILLKRLPAKTLPELCFSLQEAYNNPKKKKAKKQRRQKDGEVKRQDKQVNIQVIDSVVDVATWLKSLINKEGKKNMTLRDSHAFQLKRDQTGEVVLIRSKQWAANSTWFLFFPFGIFLSF
jgi:hypothetical protein